MRRQSMGLAVAVLVILCASPVESQALRYVDEYGVTHWVKSRDQIPEKYRDKSEKPPLPGVNPPPRSYDQPVGELCRGRHASPQIQIQCEQWMRSEARERRERLRDAEREQREYEAERRRREYELGRRPRALPYQPRP